MIISEMPIENLFQFKTTIKEAGFQKRNIAVPTTNAPVAVQPSISVSTPSIDVPALEVTQAPENEIPWGKIILITAIAAGVVYVGYRIYKSRQEQEKLGND